MMKGYDASTAQATLTRDEAIPTASASNSLTWRSSSFPRGRTRSRVSRRRTSVASSIGLLAKPAFRDAMVRGILGSSNSEAAFAKAFGDQAALPRVMIECKINPASLSGN